MRTSLIAGALALVVTAGLAGGAAAAQDSGTLYYFGSHTKHTNISFVSEAEIETIYGSSNEMGGQCFLDLEDGKGKCSLSIPVSGLKTGLPTRDEHLRSDQWLDAENYPEITLKSGDITLTAKNAAKGIYTAKVKGNLTIHGVTHERTIDATVTKLPASVAKRLGKGSWVKVAARFDVKFGDHDIKIPNADMVGPKVSETWNVAFSAFASTTKPGR